MRVSAIAERLIARGKFVVFIGQISDLPWVKERIMKLGFSRIYSDPRSFNSDPITDVLLLDSYEIAVDDPFISLKNWLHVIVMMDEHTPSYSCTLRIHPSLDSSWIKESSTPILNGPKYIPLRSSLSKKLSNPTRFGEGIKVVVVSGGSDPYNMVLEVSNILTKLTVSFEAHLFTNSPTKFASDPRFRFCEIGSSLEEVSRDANLILTSSSTSSLEFIAQGHCVGIVCVVDNQRQYYTQLGQLGVAAQIGSRIDSQGWNIEPNIIHRLITDSEYREELKNKAIDLIDFGGADRIVDAIVSLPQ
jgi:spore coat polysaccharide biosynthesis predicted glycosyltransferase SpsG